MDRSSRLLVALALAISSSRAWRVRGLSFPARLLFRSRGDRVRATIANGTVAAEPTTTTTTPAFVATTPTPRAAVESASSKTRDAVADADAPPARVHESADRSDDRRAATLRSYTDPTTGTTWSSLDAASPRAFRDWARHVAGRDPPPDAYDDSAIEVSLDDDATRARLRETWRAGTLLVARTEALAAYRSDAADADADRRRGGFSDLLHAYADRVADVLRDEREDEDRSFSLLDRLREDYGHDRVEKLAAASLSRRDPETRTELLQSFLDWFRDEFPYYYDRCDACGHSAKHDDPPSDDDDDNDKEDDGPFLGYVCPTNDEAVVGKASRTELYACRECGHVTRFPRRNAASAVYAERRGRCGEYSILLFRVLRALGHRARWVVDWADHVWAEVWWRDDDDDDDGRWVHVDPCEAALDRPLLYEGWGKEPTHVVAFEAPPIGGGDAPSIVVEDVTAAYTSDPAETVLSRREESPEDVAAALRDAERRLRETWTDRVAGGRTTTKDDRRDVAP